MARYAFVTAWQVEAPVERVWEAIHDSLAWPQWWRGVEAVEELEAGDADGLGSVRRYTWKTALPYRLAFDMRVTAVDKPWRLEGEAFGELEGSGVWTFQPVDSGTVIRYEWDVRTTRRWMNLLSPLLHPAFRWNHDYVMRAGGEGMARLLGCEVHLENPTSSRRAAWLGALVAGATGLVGLAWLRRRAKRAGME